MVTDGASLTKNSKTFERKLMGVRSPLPAPFKSNTWSTSGVYSSTIMVRNCARFVSVRLRERNDGSVGEALNLVEPVELFAARKKVGLDDRVAAMDGFGLVTDQLHRRGSRDVLVNERLRVTAGDEVEL